MAGVGNSASHQVAQAPTYCPLQYTRHFDVESTRVYTCDFSGAISVSVDGAPWARLWWNPTGDTVMEYTQAAKSRLGSWDSRFDDDYAAWLASLPPPPPPCTGDC